MKPLLILLISLTFALTSNGQKNKTSAIGNFDFENNNWAYPYAAIYRDTISNPNCIWQIGKPQKPVLDTAYSYRNVIVTDTVNSYPANDTSSFIIAQVGMFGWWSSSYAGIGGWYQVNSDSLSDFGTIEISMDTGKTWIDILTDIQYHFFDTSFWAPPVNPVRPVLTGNSNGWKYFEINFYSLVDSFPPTTPWGDTILLRFTFISDSIQTNKDGLMFDNFHLMDWFESVETINKNSLPLKPSPNPATHTIFLKEETTLTYSRKKLVVRDVMGREMIRGNYRTETIRLDVSALPSGIYAYQVVYDDGKYQSVGNFIKQ